jgi:hypothetical protein
MERPVALLALVARGEEGAAAPLLEQLILLVMEVLEAAQAVPWVKEQLRVLAAVQAVRRMDLTAQFLEAVLVGITVLQTVALRAAGLRSYIGLRGIDHEKSMGRK